jgi:hypothetical protein
LARHIGSANEEGSTVLGQESKGLREHRHALERIGVFVEFRIENKEEASEEQEDGGDLVSDYELPDRVVSSVIGCI